MCLFVSTIFFSMKPRSLVGGYQHFGGASISIIRAREQKIEAAGSCNIVAIHRPKDLLAVISHLIMKTVQWLATFYSFLML
jgi:hypothetical protein